jgi:hypothetical protein
LVIDDFKAVSSEASMTFGYAELEVNLSNEINVRGEDNTIDDMTVTLALGTEQQPITLKAKAGDKEVVFAGRLGGNLVAQRTIEDRVEPVSITNAHFNGDLSYDGQSFAVNLSLNMPQMQIIDGTPFVEKYGLSGLQEGATLDGFLSVKAVDVSSFVKDDIRDYFGDYTFEEAVRYDFALLSGDKRSYLIATFEGNSELSGKRYSVHRAYPYYSGATDDEFYYDSAFYDLNDLEGIKESLVDKASHELFDWSWQQVQGSTDFFIGLNLDTNRYTDGFMELEGMLYLSAGLPNAGESKTYALEVEDIDIYDQRPSYENHNRYTARAEVALANFKDVEGNPLANVSLAIQAERNGYLTASGNLSFALTYGEQTFVANFSYPDELVRDNYSVNIPRRFEFSDNQGGVIVFNDMDYSTSHYGYNHSGVVLPHRAKLYYHGIEYGYITQDWQGNWLVGYRDETEDLIYRAR